MAQGLVRQWVSSSAALLGALKRRIARSHALIAALDAGRYPTRAELQGWVFAEDTLQLAFPELLPVADSAVPELRRAVAAHLQGLQVLTREVSMTRAGDQSRADFVREVMGAHIGEKVVVFTSYKETASALYRSLSHIGGIALMTSAGGTVAGGTLTRRETLERFAPDACSVTRPAKRDDIRVLLTTDLLSEGVNLQDASVVVHMDVPWTAARLEQRIGRVARLGSRHATVTSYALRPSDCTEALLHMVELVENKATVARRLIGTATTDAQTEVDPQPGPVELAEAARAILAEWLIRGAASRTAHPLVTMVAAVRCDHPGALAACMVSDIPQLVAFDELWHGTTDGTSISRAIASSIGMDVDAPTELMALATDAVVRWHDNACAASDAGVSGGVEYGIRDTSRVGRLRRAAIRRADDASAERAYTDRGDAARHASWLHRTADTAMPIALEWSLYNASSNATESDSVALERLGAARPTESEINHTRDKLRVVAILIFVPVQYG